MDPTTKLVSQMVAAESCYINTAHPDFIGGHRALGLVNEKLQLKTTTSASGHDKTTQEKLDKFDPKRTTVVPSAGSGNTYTLDGNGQENSIFGSFFSSNKKAIRKPGVLEAPPAVLKASGAVSEREFIEIEVISTAKSPACLIIRSTRLALFLEMLIQSYFSIVKRTMADMVPKCIMLNLVFYAREEMQRGLLAEFYKDEVLADLLQESAETVARRHDCKKMIEALMKADEIVSSA